MPRPRPRPVGGLERLSHRAATIEDILLANAARGGIVRRDGDQFFVTCPLHEDSNPSLHLAQENGKLLVSAFCCGAKFPEILDAFGLRTNANGTPHARKATARPRPSPPSGDWRIVKTYAYYDGRNAPAYSIKRLHLFDENGMPVLDDDGKPVKKFDSTGVTKDRRILYNLPSLQYAEGQTLFVTEGEACADAVCALGNNIATTSGNANSWQERFADDVARVRPKLVAILGDNDDAGKKYAFEVAASIAKRGLTAKVIFFDGPKGHDVSDWLRDGGTLDELLGRVEREPEWMPPAAPAAADSWNDTRTLHLTPASSIQVRPVKWLWADRVPLGAMTLLGGREGVGKTICAYTLAASVTRGNLPGDYAGKPRSVIVAATEDSWEHTIVPRLMAAAADLERVFRVDVETSDGIDTTLSLPRDLKALEHAVREFGAALIILDPLLSRLDTALDTHKDAEVRVALEPLVALANVTDASVLGLIHVNKSSSSDVLTLLMGSRAFAAVARAVLFVMVDPDNESTRLLGQPKNNLGRTDLPTLTFQIVGDLVANTPEGEVWTGKLKWLGESDRTLQDAVTTAAESVGDRTATAEATDWLKDFLESMGGTCDSATIKQKARAAGHTVATLQRARQRLRLRTKALGYPRQTLWSLPQSFHQSSHTAGET